MIKGFIFDLDGVIADTADLHFLAWKKLGEKIGITIDEVFNETLKGISRGDSLELILKKDGRQDEFTPEQKEHMMEEKNADYVRLLETITPDDVLPGVTAFLTEAAEMNRLCAVASASKNAPVILEKLGIDMYFKGIVDPNDLSKGKPDPEIFLKAAALLGLTPHEVVGFEDAQAGVDAINAAGMFSIGVNPNGIALVGADQMIRSFVDISVTSWDEKE
ncbi:MAG: beta-phosphoglucomutase [Vagococcus sp.]